MHRVCMCYPAVPRTTLNKIYMSTSKGAQNISFINCTKSSTI